MIRLSTARKLAIARALRRVVGPWVALTGGDANNVTCTRQGVRWSLNLDEGVQLALYLGVFERSTSRALARLTRPGAIVIDVGANIGAQALPLARRLGSTGRLIAVEPANGAIARLRANLAMNPELGARFTVVHRALGSPGEPATGNYFASWPLQTTPNAHPVHLGAPEASTAAGSTLDELVGELGLDTVDVIKLDVDGHELPILAGAEATLARWKPAVVFELAPYLLEERGESPSALPQWFLNRGYRLYDEATFSQLPIDHGAVLNSIPASGSRNLIASTRPIAL
jgi:FkbM family methyltransferase